VRRVLHAFVLAELVEVQTRAAGRQFVIYEPDPDTAQHLRSALRDGTQHYAGKVVRDPLALQLLLKRVRPDALVFAADQQQACQTIHDLAAADAHTLGDMQRVAIAGSADAAADQWRSQLGFIPDAVVPRPYTVQQLYACLDQLLDESLSDSSESPTPSAPISAASMPASATAGVQ
jgi:hypothetical protein